MATVAPETLTTDRRRQREHRTRLARRAVHTARYWRLEGQHELAVEALNDAADFRALAAMIPPAEIDNVKRFVNRHWDGLYTTSLAGEPGAGGRLYKSTLHGPNGPVVFTFVDVEGHLHDWTRTS